MIVVWLVTEYCNLSCPFCMYDKSRKRVRREAELEPVLRFGRLLGEYRKQAGERVLISWLGGEPLLWQPLFSVSKTLREQYRLEFSLTTNGTFLHREKVQARILESLSELTISVDGFADKHNNLRGWKNGWRQIKTAVCALATRKKQTGTNLKLRINTVLMHDNVRDFSDLCIELASWGIDEITFNQLGGRDRPEFYPSHRLQVGDVEYLNEIIPGLRMQLAGMGVRLCGSEDYLRRIEASSRDLFIPVDNCLPGEGFLFVDENYRVSPCSFTVNELGIPVSELTTVDNIKQLPFRYAMTRLQHPPSQCNNCTSTRVFAKFKG